MVSAEIIELKLMSSLSWYQRHCIIAIVDSRAMDQSSSMEVARAGGDPSSASSAGSSLIISNISNLVPIKLDETNYLLWKSLFEHILKGY